VSSLGHRLPRVACLWSSLDQPMPRSSNIQTIMCAAASMIQGSPQRYRDQRSRQQLRQQLRTVGQ
jgi:hypothetical protein